MKLKFLKDFQPISVSLVLAMICITENLSAQTSRTDPIDWQTWYGTTIKKDLPHQWAAALSWQGRNYNNLKTHNGDYFSIEAEKKFLKKWGLEAEYRLAQVIKGTYHRYSLGGSYETKIKGLKTSARFLVQNQLQDFDDPTEPISKSLYYRTRLGLKGKWNSRMEWFLQTEPIMKKGGRHFLDNIRNTAGTKLKISNQVGLELFYIFRPDFAKSYRRTFHVVGGELAIKL
jgi:hypothetical protein